MLPENLYHYTPADGLKGIATSASVWTSAAQYLDDGQVMKLAPGIAKHFRSERKYCSRITSGLLQ